MTEILETFVERIKTGKFSDNPELQAAYEQGRLDERCQNILNNSLVWSDGKERTKEQIDKAFPHLVNAINTGNDKEAGYPQGRTRVVYVIQTVSDFTKTYPYGECIRSSHNFPSETTADIPTYLEVWLWLWREKNIKMPIGHYKETFIVADEINMIEFYSKNDPEEAIVAAIEYLVTNVLIK